MGKGFTTILAVAVFVPLKLLAVNVTVGLAAVLVEGVPPGSNQEGGNSRSSR